MKSVFTGNVGFVQTDDGVKVGEGHGFDRAKDERTIARDGAVVTKEVLEEVSSMLAPKKAEKPAKPKKEKKAKASE